MIWIIFTLLSTWLLVAFTEINRYYRLDGVRLNFWRTLVGVMALLPFIGMFYWPAPGLFYLFAIFTGVCIFVGTGVLMNLAARGLGRVSSLQMPVKVFALFLLWLLIEPEGWQSYVASPWQTVGILGCFVLAAVALQFVRRNDAGWRVFIEVAPLGLLFALSEIAIKLALVDVPLYRSLFTYIFIAYLTSLVFTAFWLAARHVPEKPLLPPRMLQAAVMIGLVSLACFATLLVALAYAPNPAYPAALTLSMPFWLQLWHKFQKVPDDASPVAGTLLVVAGIGVVLLTL